LAQRHCSLRQAYSQTYPAVDLVFYGTQRQLEYDFVVSPGVDASAMVSLVVSIGGVASRSDATIAIQEALCA
jgi:hypothetical protein